MPATARDVLDKTRRLQITLYLAAKKSRTRRFHALYDKIHRIDVLQRAWSQVKHNSGAPGVDAETIEAIEASGVDGFLSAIEAELRSGRYRPQAVRRVSIPKPQGGERPLGIPAVRDRVVQAAAKVVLEPIFEASFADCSFGFRPKRSAHQARERIRRGIQREQRRWVVDADIESFFDTLDRPILMALLRRRISDRRVLALIQAWLDVGVLDGARLLHPDAGTPQGGVISPLLANVYLNALDQLWERHHRSHGVLTRYADDLVVLCWQRRYAERALAALGKVLRRLKLRLSATKTRLVSLEEERSGFDFLGYHYRWIPTRDRARRYAACWPSQRAMRAARRKIRALTPYDRINLPVIMVVQDLNRFLLGWAAYFRHGNSTRQFKSLDDYVLDRLARFISRKHGRRGVDYGLATVLRSKSRLGLVRIAGTIRYDSTNAAGERGRRAV